MLNKVSNSTMAGIIKQDEVANMLSSMVDVWCSNHGERCYHGDFIDNPLFIFETIRRLNRDYPGATEDISSGRLISDIRECYNMSDTYQPGVLNMVDLKKLFKCQHRYIPPTTITSNYFIETIESEEVIFTADEIYEEDMFGSASGEWSPEDGQVAIAVKIKGNTGDYLKLNPVLEYEFCQNGEGLIDKLLFTTEDGSDLIKSIPGQSISVGDKFMVTFLTVKVEKSRLTNRHLIHVHETR